jgi:hypothetical protein
MEKPNNINEPIHFRPFNDSFNVRCLNGSAHASRTSDITKVNCLECLNPKTNKDFWDAHERKHGNVNKN